MSKARSLARKRAVQALYMWQMTGQNISDIDQQFVLENDMDKVDMEYFHELLHRVPAVVDELDTHIEPVLDRPLAELDPVEYTVMRIGVYELQFRLDIPYKVAINEAVKLAKTYGAEEGHKYVNSILDHIARKLRAVEIKAAANK
ncbi:MAG: transcription antitermination factor NusB [Gammaproteobacteria bacterium]|nr:transcription antitermination factor NusB [Gammaproteobacteria bacterium]MDH5799319.1 transcription antitermination factor NusB [Gammaproteobacteria bacterium]